jgi:4-carboxymuconolactone decarboxylase
MMEWRDEMDQHYARIWLEWTYGGLFERGVLSHRVRLLVLIGQCIGMNELHMLGSHIRAALGQGATPREVLEVIIQINVYIGYQRVERAVQIFREILAELGRMEEVTASQLPLNGTRTNRTEEEDRATWRVSIEQFPRREEMVKKYGWEGVGSGLRLQPTHHVTTLEKLDRLDENFTKLWEDFVYGGMYTRGILDEKTRELIVVGELIVLNEPAQIENHMRAALMQGVSPRELLEVVLHSTAHVGMPSMTRVVSILERILGEQGRMAEITAKQLPLPVREG